MGATSIDCGSFFDGSARLRILEIEKLVYPLFKVDLLLLLLLALLLLLFCSADAGDGDNDEAGCCTLGEFGGLSRES